MWDPLGLYSIRVQLSTVLSSQRTIINLLHSLTERQVLMSQAVDDLVTEVAALKTVGDSTTALLDKLFALVQAGIDSGDITKVQQAVDDLKAEKQALADAVSRNTVP